MYATGDYETTPLNVPLTAAVVESTLPKIRVTDTTDLDHPVDMSEGVTADFSATTPTVTKTFLIENVGARNLLLYSKTATFTPDEGTGENDFTVIAFADDGQADGGFPPAPIAMTIIAPVPQGCPNLFTTAPDSTTFTVTFTAPFVKQSTTFSGTISFTSNDNDVPDTNFSFLVTATVAPATPTQPEEEETTTEEEPSTETPSTQIELTVTPPTYGTIMGNPSGIYCGTDSTQCTATYDSQTVVQLTAIPASGILFDSWGEECGNETRNPLSVTLDKEKKCSAIFKFVGVTLSISPPALGNIISTSAGIHCGTGGTQCATDYSLGQAITLMAVPEANSTFTHWIGGCMGASNPLVITMDKAKNCSANFDNVSLPKLLMVSKIGNGVLTSDSGDFHCGDQCVASYTPGQAVTLTAMPASDSMFAGWGGDCSRAGTGDTAVVMVDTAKNCIALFFLKFFIIVCPPTGPAPLTVIAEVEGLVILNATYHWQSSGNPQVSISDTATTLFTFDVSGLHTIGLTVIDANGQVVGQMQKEVAVDVFLIVMDSGSRPISYSDLGSALIVGARGSLENATTAFLGGIAVNQANSFDKISRVKLCEEVDVRGLIKVNPAHVGQPAEMVVYANAEPYGYYMLEESSLKILSWDEKPENLLPFRKAVTLAAEQPVEMYRGHFYYPGKVSVFFGYRLADGTVVTSDQAIEVTIRE